MIAPLPLKINIEDNNNIITEEENEFEKIKLEAIKEVLETLPEYIGV